MIRLHGDVALEWEYLLPQSFNFDSVSSSCTNDVQFAISLFCLFYILTSTESLTTHRKQSDDNLYNTDQS